MSLKPVLLAEDDSNDCLFFEMAFKKAGILNPLTVFNDGEGVLSYLNASRATHPFPAILFIDLSMKRVSGLEVLHFVKANNLSLEFPSVVLSGMQDLKQVAEAYQHGAHSFLLKPLHRENFGPFIKTFKGIESA
jgi:two-component system response regulator